jgi:hypothetical protein
MTPMPKKPDSLKTEEKIANSKSTGRRPLPKIPSSDD